MKTYFKLTITDKKGKTYQNPLQNSELNLIPQILKENQSILIERGKCTPQEFKLIFG